MVKRVSIYDNRSPTSHQQAANDILKQIQKLVQSGQAFQLV